MLEIWSIDNFKVVYIVDYSISYNVFICHKPAFHKLFPHLHPHSTAYRLAVYEFPTKIVASTQHKAAFPGGLSVIP